MEIAGLDAASRVLGGAVLGPAEIAAALGFDATAVLDDTERRAVARLEGRAQRLVTPRHLGQGAGEGRHVERPAQAQKLRDVVGGRAGLQLVEEPEALLGEGEREFVGLAAPAYGGRL